MNDVLIVDDKPENLNLLVQLLTEQGYQVRPALSGKIALKAVKEDLPGLILLDIMMPGMDGFEVCAKLKEDERTKNIPVIFVSALDDTDAKVKAFQAGGVDYVTKPFHAAEVAARVKTHLTLQQMQMELHAEIEKRKRFEKALIQANEELESKVESRTTDLNKRTESLKETNIALKVLLDKREEDKQALEENVLFNIEKLVLPYLSKLMNNCTDQTQKYLLEIIQLNLAEATSSFAQNYKSHLSSLTPTQIQIADLIKQGKTTKEIASLLNLAPATISCHRREIRKRLSLTNRKLNLQAALTANS